MTDSLDRHLLFQFKFLSNKTKKVNYEILRELKQISCYSLRDLKQSGRTQGGYNSIEVNTTKLPKSYENDFINYIFKKHEISLDIKINKYDYLRVGKKERIYGKLFDNVFYVIIYDPNKDYL